MPGFHCMLGFPPTPLMPKGMAPTPLCCLLPGFLYPAPVLPAGLKIHFQSSLPTGHGRCSPVPNSMSTKSSKTMGRLRDKNGWTTHFPFKCRYLGSLGCTATATSPSMVSTRVVATTTSSSLSGVTEGSVSELPPPPPPSPHPGVLSSHLSLGPCRQRTQGPQTPPSPCSQAQRAGCGLSVPSYPPVRWVFKQVGQTGLGKVRGRRAAGRGIPQCQKWQS